MMDKKKHYYLVNNEKIDIISEDWDILIILDACRYDMFRKVYEEILGDMGGTLKKAISPATWTMDWLNKIFGNNFYKDIVYVSGNTFINSKQKICHRLIIGERKCFDGKKHFRRIVDVWDWGFDPEVGTTPPIEVSKAAVVSIDLNPKKRFILHYMQPHFPHIYLRKKSKKKFSMDDEKRTNIGSKIKKTFYVTTDTLVDYGLLSHEKVWRISEKLGLLSEGSRGKPWIKYGWDGIRRGYQEDLKLVLNEVKHIIERYSPNKKIIITADHGMRLGERGNYWYGKRRFKEVIEVPWFEISNIDKNENK